MSNFNLAPIARIAYRPSARRRLLVVAAALVAVAVVAILARPAGGALLDTHASGSGQSIFGLHPSGGGFNPLYAISGLLVGVLVGVTGVGGGSLMTPLLVLVFGFHPGAAVGTDLLYASATKTVGTVIHGANSTVDWRITRRMAAGSIPAAIVSVAVLYMLHIHGDAASRLISTLLGYALIFTAVSLLFRTQLFAFAARRLPEPSARATAVATVVLGAVLGVLITFTSVGAGAIGVTVLIFLYPRMPVARIVGSDIAHAVPLTLIAGVGHWFLGSINLPLLGSLLVGSVPGIMIGSLATPRIPERVLRPIMAATLVLVGGKLVF